MSDKNKLICQQARRHMPPAPLIATNAAANSYPPTRYLRWKCVRSTVNRGQPAKTRRQRGQASLFRATAMSAEGKLEERRQQSTAGFACLFDAAHGGAGVSGDVCTVKSFSVLVSSCLV